MLDLFPVFLLSLVAILWGTTNALLKKNSVGIEKVENHNNSRLRNLLAEISFLLKNWKYLLTYGVNQCGSVLYYYALGYCDLAIAGPLTNTLTFVVTYFADQKFNEVPPTNSYQRLGLVLICSGVLLCLSS